MFVNGEDCALTTADKTAGSGLTKYNTHKFTITLLKYEAQQSLNFSNDVIFCISGRRGLCGTMFTFKIAGAMAEAGT